LDEASTWAESTVGFSVTVGDTEYASRLRHSFFNAGLKRQPPSKPDNRFPKTVKEAKALMKTLLSDNQIRVCKDMFDGLKLLGYIRGIVESCKISEPIALDYVLACAYTRFIREFGQPPVF
jgi:uncharacterized protein (DUF2235 family)